MQVNDATLTLIIIYAGLSFLTLALAVVFLGIKLDRKENRRFCLN